MTVYEPAIDLSSIVAIDTHVHIEMDADGRSSLPDDLAEAASKYFASGNRRPELEAVADYYREQKMAAVVFTVDATTNLRHEPLSSEDIVAGAARNNDVLIPYGSVDPLRGAAAVEQAKKLIDAGVRGFKFHPTVQGFIPSDEEFYPLYEVLQEAGVVALFHTGQTGIGAGLPGGRGLLLGHSNPMYLDPVAAHFPDLQIVMAHPSVPWQDEALSVATHKHNVWIDLSGWSPKYFPASLVRYAGSIIKDRVLFGSDFPLLTPERWMKDIQETSLRPEALPGILKDNAVRLLGLDAS